VLTSRASCRRPLAVSAGQGRGPGGSVTGAGKAAERAWEGALYLVGPPAVPPAEVLVGWRAYAATAWETEGTGGSQRWMWIVAMG
jgi:hypothetical protein